MNQQYYTYLGCSCAIEHYVSMIEGAPEAVATAGADLAAVRVALLNSSSNDNSEEAFKELFENHVVVIIEAIEIIRTTSGYQNLDQQLTDLLDHFYDLADSIMGGGDDILWTTGSTSFVSQ